MFFYLPVPETVGEDPSAGFPDVLLGSAGLPDGFIGLAVFRLPAVLPDVVPVDIPVVVPGLAFPEVPIPDVAVPEAAVPLEPAAPPVCASAIVLVSASAEANARVVIFIVVSLVEICITNRKRRVSFLSCCDL
jgi:hypothetical protein